MMKLPFTMLVATTFFLSCRTDNQGSDVQSQSPFLAPDGVPARTACDVKNRSSDVRRIHQHPDLTNAEKSDLIEGVEHSVRLIELLSCLQRNLDITQADAKWAKNELLRDFAEDRDKLNKLRERARARGDQNMVSSYDRTIQDRSRTFDKLSKEFEAEERR